jgi:hypothetical protein
MTQSEETYLGWVKGAYFMTSRSLFYMARGLIEELGPEKGKEVFVNQIKKMGEGMGKQTREYYDSTGKEANMEEFLRDGFSDSSVYMHAWEGDLKTLTKHEAIVDFTSCPYAEGFKALGEEGVEIGELYCNNIDDAITQAYNPKYECVRSPSLNKDGVCTLHWKLKE